MDLRVRRFAASPHLARWVRSFTIVETTGEATRTLVPDSGLVLGVRYGGSARDGQGRLPAATLVGMRDSPRHMTTSAGGGIVLATFRAGGAAAFFREPLHELFGTTVPLETLVPPVDADRVLARIATARGDAERLARLEELLLERLRPDHPGDPVIAHALAVISGRAPVRVADLAASLGLSRDRLEKRFRHAVGTTPKQLATLLRLERALALGRAGSSLTQVSAEAGYFDQSHFIRDVRRFTGSPPTQVLDAARFC